MKTKIILAVLIVLFVIGFTFFVRIGQEGYQSSGESTGSIGGENEEATASQGDNNTGGQDVTNGKIPLSELSQHNSLEDCWISYNGKVYDVTSYLPRHPGSAGKILPYCGSATEFEEAFTRKHGTSKVSLLMNVGTFMGDFDVMGGLGN
ncbi:MAG: cytochrome b5-like heme/steroid binding domain-containing protein [archaeon]